MYRCEQCKEVLGPGVPLQREVMETRVKLYPVRLKVNRVIRRDKPEKIVWVDDAGGEGREIVRELSLCARCKAAGSQ